MKMIFNNMAGLFLAASALVFATPLAAQKPAASSAICMTRVTTGAGAAGLFTIIVQKHKSGSFKARGYKAAACKGKLSQRGQYKQQICQFAKVAPSPVQTDFKRTHGATPTELCEATE